MFATSASQSCPVICQSNGDIHTASFMRPVQPCRPSFCTHEASLPWFRQLRWSLCMMRVPGLRHWWPGGMTSVSNSSGLGWVFHPLWRRSCRSEAASGKADTGRHLPLILQIAVRSAFTVLRLAHALRADTESEVGLWDISCPHCCHPAMIFDVPEDFLCNKQNILWVLELSEKPHPITQSLDLESCLSPEPHCLTLWPRRTNWACTWPRCWFKASR